MFPLLYHLQKASLEVDYYEAVAFCFSYVGGQLSRKIVEDMDPFHGACEIVELRDELVASQHSKETNRLSGGPIVDGRTEKFSRQKTAGRYTLEDEINKLFEAIEVRASARGLGPSCQFSQGSSQISASKKPIRGGISQASGIGISESVTLKQALRGLRISHASEAAAMKRVSKSTASSKVAEAVAVKRLYRAVVVEANDSGLTLDESKGCLLQISLVPEEICSSCNN
ncbi:hypothetical protein IFM89_020020 [Coptis chinensis]|uniref:Uncharacterized protein n=1 Tax=Coptis chinensis TaxID=261450 RepID=A0A835INU7_9MAGN|nr:hypothetical protein IFM89_020020 [Coptis chinensis]